MTDQKITDDQIEVLATWAATLLQVAGARKPTADLFHWSKAALNAVSKAAPNA